LRWRKPGVLGAPEDRRIPNVLETPMKILLPVDGSEHTKRMLSYIAAHDELLGPGHDYTILTVVAPVPAYATRFLERGTVDGYYDEQAELVLKPVRAFAEQQHWTVHLAHTHGHAAESIAARAAADKTDLIVMGTHGHTALGNVVLGSVASGVLARSKVPVLLIR
jgi:nucleotide-binding universal stress UspA family protein